MSKALFLLAAIITVFFTGCTAVPDPTPAPFPATAVADAAPIVVERPSPTVTVTREVEEVETAVVPLTTPTHTLIPTNTPLPTPTVSSTSTPVATTVITWSVMLQEAARVNNGPIAWSPTANKFLFSPPMATGDILTSGFLFLSSAPNFVPESISPTNLQFADTSTFDWHPQGEKIVIAAFDESTAGQYWSGTKIWIYDLLTGNTQSLGIGWNWKWMDNSTLAISSYQGGGHFYTNVVNVMTGEQIAYASVIHLGSIINVNSNYVLLNWGADYLFDVSAAVISRTENLSASELFRESWGPYIHTLSDEYVNDRQKKIFNSRVEDWQAETNEALVFTWGSDKHLGEIDLVHDTAITDLQLWDVDSDQLTLLVPGSVYGRFSPDGHFLAFITPAHPAPYMQLLDRIRGEVLFSLPASVPEADNGYFVEAGTSYSPDSRYFTFFAPESDTSAVEEVVRLEVYDLEAKQFLCSLPARQYMPVWSPDGLRFVYRDGEGILALFDLGNGRSTPLALIGGSRLFNPQWSYDGTYLSVGIRQEDGGVETAVLRTP